MDVGEFVASEERDNDDDVKKKSLNREEQVEGSKAVTTAPGSKIERQTNNGDVDDEAAERDGREKEE